MIPGDKGRVEPMRNRRQDRPRSVEQNFYLQGNMTQHTREQMMVDAERNGRRAVERS
jgi:hypothetical protein